MSKYTVDYFIRKLSRIPAKKWTTGDFERDGKCCVIGHLKGRTILNGATNALTYLLALNVNSGPITINDGKSPRYQQKTPRARILAALRDVKKMEEAK